MKYITLVSSKEYLLAALTLNASLKRVKAKYPLVIAITEDIATTERLSAITAEGAEYIIISQLHYPPSEDLDAFIATKQSLYNTAAKIALFNLDWDEKLVFLDGDIIVRRNIDDLFDYHNGAILQVASEPAGMSGMFVFTPKYYEYRFYEAILNHVPNILDGNIIGSLFFPMFDNPDYCIPAEEYFGEDVMLRGNERTYHCNGEKKPFLMPPQELSQYMNLPAYQMYCKEYLPLRLKYPLL